VTAVEIPTHVCHILNTHFCGEDATIGHDCADTPIWSPLPCVDYDTVAVACTPKSLTLTPAASVSLPLVPLRDEAH
jgi:hypothetical protein